MKMGKLLRVIVSCVFIALAVFPAAALAVSGMQDGLQLSLTTDKGSYAKDETIDISAAVTNTNNFNVTGVRLEIIVPTGLSFKTSGATGLMDLTSGQTADLKSEAVLSKEPDGMPKTGDNSPVDVLLLLVLLSAGALASLLISRRKNRAGFLSILLCLTLISSSSFLIPAPARASADAKSFTVSLPVSVDGENCNIQAILTYNLPAPVSCAVTVNNGTGGGNYAPGTSVTITADAPNPGDAFTGWTVVSGGVTLASASSTTTTFTMPTGPVEVTATYELITYAVTVNGGTGDGSYAPGAVVTITADAPNPGDAFTGWTVVSGGVTLADSSSATTTFTMPANPVVVTATYELIRYAVTVNSGTGDGSYAPGATVTITADAPNPGDAFTGWTVVSGGVTLADSSSATTTFTMPARPVEVTATYELITYAVTVNSGTGDGSYAPGAVVTITADAPNPGDAFTGWTVVSGGVTLADSFSAATTFTMPANPVVVTATYELITYAVTVNSGTGDGSYAPGATVTITADAPGAGYAFTGWTVVSGGVTLGDPSSAATSFTMPANPVEVTAAYELITYAVTVNSGTGDGNYAPGAAVTITADAPASGMAFNGWTVVSGGVTLDNPSSAATTFTMPSTPVVVTASYKITLDFSSSIEMDITTLAGGLPGQAVIVGRNGVVNAAYATSIDLSGNAAALALAQTIPMGLNLTGLDATFTLSNSMVLIGTSIGVYADIYTAPSGSNVFTRRYEIVLSPVFTGVVNIGSYTSGSVSGLNVSVSAEDRVILVCYGSAAGLQLLNTLKGTVTGHATFK